MSIERKRILKSFIVLCEGRDAQGFLIEYLNSKALAHDQRFSDEIQVFDFGGNDNLSNSLMSLKNMDGFDQVTNLAIIRDAEKNYTKACQEINGSLKRCGFPSPENSGMWVYDASGPKVGFLLFPLNNSAGTLEDLCLRILSEKNKSILSSIDAFLATMESSRGRKYRRKHKNELYTYLSSSDEYVTMPLGIASKSGAFDWGSDELDPLKRFLTAGFSN